MSLHTVLLLLLAVLALLGLLSAPLALAAGAALSLALGNPAVARSSRVAKLLLQLSVVGLGFGVALAEVWNTGRAGLLVTLGTIAATLAAGWALGAALRVPPRTSALVSFGTAICGGSAIAAMAPVLKADDDEVGVSLATVFLLNAVGLFVFPPIGRWLELSQAEFGYWAALAIHDTSSVVAAGAVYGPAALGIATTVKLARAVWIAPITLIAARLTRGGGRAAVPWFILGFVAAAAVRAWLPEQEPIWNALALAARRLLVVTLLLIGAGMTRAVLFRVGPRPLLQGLALWVLVSVAALVLVTYGTLAF